MNKIVLLIGHSTGLGYMCAERLVKESGVKVYATAPDLTPMKSLEEHGATLLEIDVTDAASIDRVTQTVMSREGRIDVVHYNAGVNIARPVEMMDEENAQLIFNVNVLGLGRVIRSVTPHFRKERAGRLVVTGSVVSHFSTLGAGWYAATKHALYGLLTAYRQEVSDFGIKVVIIEPGQINTGFEQGAIAKLEEQEIDEDYTAQVRQWSAFTLDRLKKCPTGEKTAELMVKAITTDKPKLIYKTSSDAVWVPKVVRLLGPKRADKFFKGEFAKADPIKKINT